MHPRLDAALRPPVLRRPAGRRRRHASRETLLFSSPSQFLRQGLFPAPGQHARVLDGPFFFLCLRLGLPPLADRDPPLSFRLLRRAFRTRRAPRQIHALLYWRWWFYFEALRGRRGLPSRQSRYLSTVHVVVPSTRIVFSINQPSEQQIGVGIVLLFCWWRWGRTGLPLVSSRVICRWTRRRSRGRRRPPGGRRRIYRRGRRRKVVGRLGRRGPFPRRR